MPGSVRGPRGRLRLFDLSRFEHGKAAAGARNCNEIVLTGGLGTPPLTEADAAHLAGAGFHGLPRAMVEAPRQIIVPVAAVVPFDFRRADEATRRVWPQAADRLNVALDFRRLLECCKTVLRMKKRQADRAAENDDSSRCHGKMDHGYLRWLAQMTRRLEWQYTHRDGKSDCPRADPSGRRGFQALRWSRCASAHPSWSQEPTGRFLNARSAARVGSSGMTCPPSNSVSSTERPSA